MGSVRLLGMPNTEVNTRENLRRIIEYMLSEDQILDLINAARNELITEIDHTDSPYTLTANDRLVICDTSGGAITVNLVSSSVVSPGHKFKLVALSASNDVTIGANGNKRNGSTSDGSVSGAYSVKTLTLLNTDNEYLEE